MGAAAAASATAMVHAQHAAVAKAAGGKLAQPVEVDVQKLHFREVGGEKWVDPSLSEWPESARRTPPDTPPSLLFPARHHGGPSLLSHHSLFLSVPALSVVPIL